MKNKNLLIVCYHIKDFKKIQKINTTKYETIIVVSDDLTVHKQCKAFEFVSVFIDRAISYKDVSSEVILIVEEINKWQKNFAASINFNPEMFFWTKYPEGGRTTQKVQDILILIESYTRTIEEYYINKVVVLCSNTNLEHQVLNLFIKSKGIEYKILSNRYIFDKNTLKEKFKLYLAPLYRLIKTAIIKLQTHRMKKIKNHKNTLLFHLCGASIKHIDNILFPIPSLIKKGINPIVISWGQNKEISRYISKESHLVYLEQYLTTKNLVLSFVNYIKLLFYVTISKNNFFSEVKIEYRNVNLSTLLYPYVKTSMLEFVPTNINLDRSFRMFLIEFPNIVATKLCHAMFLNDGTILASLLRKRKILQIDYQVGVMAKSPYRRDIIRNNNIFFNDNYIYFASGAIEKNMYLDESGVKSDNIISMGHGKANNHLTTISNFSKEKSLHKLSIPTSYDFYILYDFPTLLKGYQSREEVIATLMTLIEFATKFSNIAVMIKPHPSADTLLLNEILNKYKLSNIYLFSKKQKPEHILNIADILITKFSTLGIEAMIYKILVISCLFDKSTTLKIFGNAATYLYSSDELTKQLELLISLKKNNYSKEYLKKMNIFLNKYFSILEKSSNDIFAEEIFKRIDDIRK